MEKGGERERVTRESWRESVGKRRVGGNREKDIDIEGEKGKREIYKEGEERERECVCLGTKIERGNKKETQI